MLARMAERADPDLDHARRFLASHPPPGRVVLCAVVGAHQRGVVPPTAGLELGGAHLVPTRALLGIDPRPVRHTAAGSVDGAATALVSDELAPVLGALIAGDGRMLERVLSPWQVVTTALLDPLQNLARGAISRRFAPHYTARLEDCRDAHGSRPTAASMLDAYQVALTGIHLLRSGRMEANVGVLASYYGYPGATELADLVRSGLGEQALAGSLATHHAARLPILAEALAAAASTSTLPTEATNRREIEAWLVDLRVRELR
jgi:hypothetical protein